MVEPASGHATGATRADRRRAVLMAAGALVLAAVLWGGYSHRWPWTGINGGTATLWDWLHLLLLPLAVVVLPVWLRSDTRVGARTKSRSVTGLGAFVLLVILGYTVPWGWTGFRGNTVWDWLKLLVLPLAVVLVPQFAELRRRRSPRHIAIACAAAAVFAVLILGGYLGRWAWTGFEGNTLWDWLNLLLLPVLLPTLIVPALTPKVMGEVVYLDADGNVIELDADGTPVEGDTSTLGTGPAPGPDASAAEPRAAAAPPEPGVSTGVPAGSAPPPAPAPGGERRRG